MTDFEKPTEEAPFEFEEDFDDDEREALSAHRSRTPRGTQAA
jgi:hypothetical protein